MRAAWKGVITLGQLGIPVRLYTMVKPAHPRFVQLHEKDGSPVERALRCREEGVGIPAEEIVRAIEYEPGKYLPLHDDEIERGLAQSTKTIAVTQFCDHHAVASAYYEKPFYVTPARGGEHGYVLLREVFTKTHKIAITQYVMHGREHIATLETLGDVLVLNQMRFATEILPRSDIRTPALPKPSPLEIDTLTSVVERFSSPFYIQDHHDEYAEHINTLVERKRQGLPAPRQERIEPRATPSADILPALQDVLAANQNTVSLARPND